MPDVAAAELLHGAIAECLRDCVVDAAKLGDWLRVLADGDVRRDAVSASRPAGPRVGDDDRGRLSQAVSLISAEHVAGGDGFDEAIGEMTRLAFARLERSRDRLEHLRSDENVSLRDVVLSGAMTGPLLRTCSGVLRRSAFDVDDADLPRRRPGIGREQSLESVGRRVAARERVEELVAVLGARVRLSRDGPNSFANPRHTAADARDARRDRNSDFAGARIDRGDREGVEDERVTPFERDLSV